MTTAARIPSKAAADAPRIRAAVTSLPPYVAGRRATSSATAALASNESHFPPLPSVLAEVAASTGRLNRYPDSAAVVLRDRIAAHVGVSLDEVAVGPGSVGVLQQIIGSVCEAGDEVIFAWRSFEAYPLFVTLAGGTPVAVLLTPDEGHDLDAMAAAIGPRTRAILLCTPNNPTGVTIPGPELDDFLSRVPGDVLVVIDEAYLEYVTPGARVDTLARYRRHPNVVLLRTFSKAYGLAGLRVGYAVAAPTVAAALQRTAIPFGVSSIAQVAAIASLDAQDELAERVGLVIAERERLILMLRHHGWTVPTSQANFIWLRADARVERLVRAFDSADILVRGYAGDGVRITIADATTNDRVIRVLAGWVAAA